MQTGLVKGAPGFLGDGDIARLRRHLRHQRRPVGRQFAAVAALFVTARRAAGDIDQHHRQLAGAETGGKLRAAVNHRLRLMHHRQANDAVLQVDDNQCGVGIKGSQSHGKSSQDALSASRCSKGIAAMSSWRSSALSRVSMARTSQSSRIARLAAISAQAAGVGV